MFSNMRSTPAPDIVEALDPDQTAVAAASGGHVLVVAGAGSGKTRALAARVARLVGSGVHVADILLLTFTRRAAAELLDRAVRVAGQDGIRRVRGGTFHSMALAELRRCAQVAGLTAGFSVIDPADVAELIGIVRTDLGHGEDVRRFPRPATVADIYTRMVSTQRPLVAVLDDWFPWCAPHIDALRAIFEAYSDRKADQGLLDFDDLLLYWLALLETGGEAPSGFGHVLVDEAQDLNRVQLDILAALAARGATITAVGDDAQAIYGFRGADVGCMHDFPRRFPGTAVLRLERNYRSTPEICESANAVMSQAGSPFPKTSRAMRRSGAPPRLVTCPDEATQARYVCDRILEHREDGVALREQAILVRTGHHGDVIELELRRRDIPYVVYGGLRFLERAHVRDFVAMLRVLENPRDELALHRVLRLLDGVGPATARRIQHQLSSSGGRSALIDAELPLPAHAREGFVLLREALRDCVAEPEPPVTVQAERLVELCRVLLAGRYDDMASRIADLEVLAATAGLHRTRAELIAGLVLEPPARTGAPAGEPHLDDDYVVLSTIHGVKGLEYRVVHVVHAADGNIPSDMATGTAKEIEEERRLLYVALTRARDHLYVTWPLRYYHHPSIRRGVHDWAQLSRFLVPARHAFHEEQVGWSDACHQSATKEVAQGDGPNRVRSAVAALWR